MALGSAKGRRLVPAGWAAAVGCVTAGSFDQVCTVSRYTFSADGAGGQLRTYATVAAGVPCRVALENDAPAGIGVGGQVEDTPGWVVAMPLGTEVRLADRIVIDGGPTLLVQQTNTPASHPAEVQVLASTQE